MFLKYQKTMRELYLLLLMIFSINMHSQSLSDLESDPSFKGITIGAPISKYINILTFSHSVDEKNVYKVKNVNYLSIFNVKMQEMIVVENKGKVYAIQLSKRITADSNGCYIFNADELLSWCSNLISKYGKFNVSLDSNSGIPTVCGMRWKTNTIQLDIAYLFYGTITDKEPVLQYILQEYHEDY